MNSTDQKDVDETIRWILRDPLQRLNNGRRYYDEPGNCIYKKLRAGAEYFESYFKNTNYKISLKLNKEPVRDSHGYIYHKYAEILSDLYQQDLWINPELGRKVHSDDEGKFIKRCDTGWKQLDEEWVCCTDLIRPGEFGRILDIVGDHIYIIVNKTDIAHMDELGSHDLMICLHNDDGFIFL